MALLNNKMKETTTKSVSKGPRDRYMIGTSECFYEPADYIKADLEPTKDDPRSAIEKITSLFANEKMRLSDDCEGRSLKVMVNTGIETKFVGFVTAGNGDLSLDKEDIEPIMEHATTENIVKAISASNLVSMF